MEPTEWCVASDEEVELLIADVSDAFWLVPLHPSERRYFVARYRDHWYVFKRTGQGSMGAPLSWAAIAALLARCIQGLYAVGNEDEARLQMYVDDPLLAVRGRFWRRRRLVVRFCVGFLLLGFRLAFNKAQYSSSVVWIGVGLSISSRRLVATIPEDKLRDILQLVEDMLACNVVAEKKVRTLAGKSMSIASLIVVWRPFLAPFWAALSYTTSRAPRGCVWVRQVSWALLWLKEFLSHNHGPIVRILVYETFFKPEIDVEITSDASPFGLGAWLAVNGVILEWFAEPITDTDELVLGATRGSCDSQQAFESLLLLMAL
jgi:hypothetical protein